MASLLEQRVVAEVVVGESRVGVGEVCLDEIAAEAHAGVVAKAAARVVAERSRARVGEAVVWADVAFVTVLLVAEATAMGGAACAHRDPHSRAHRPIPTTQHAHHQNHPVFLTNLHSHRPPSAPLAQSDPSPPPPPNFSHPIPHTPKL